MATRLGVFPFKIIYTTFIECLEEVPLDVAPFYWPFNIGLMSLVALHVFWLFLIIRVAYRTIKHGEIEDVREEDEVESKSGKKSKMH
jgi:ceramide synthetase